METRVRDQRVTQRRISVSDVTRTKKEKENARERALPPRAQLKSGGATRRQRVRERGGWVAAKHGRWQSPLRFLYNWAGQPFKVKGARKQMTSYFDTFSKAASLRRDVI